MRYLLCLLPSLLLLSGLAAQSQKTMHFTLPLDSVDQVTLDLFDTYEVQSWAGGQLLLQTDIEIYSGNDNILDHLIEGGRYAIADTLSGGQLQLRSVDREREPVRTPRGEVFEVVKIQVFLPEEFGRAGEHVFRRGTAPAAEEQSAAKDDKG